jgi:hypothetical protein
MLGYISRLGADKAVAYADAIIDLADKHNRAYFRLGGQILKGCAMARQGAGPAGLELMRRSASERIGTGATWSRSAICACWLKPASSTAAQRRGWLPSPKRQNP